MNRPKLLSLALVGLLAVNLLAALALGTWLLGRLAVPGTEARRGICHRSGRRPSPA